MRTRARANSTRSLAVMFLIAALLVAVLVPGRAQPVRQGADSGFLYGYLPSIAGGDLDFSDDAIPFDSSMPHTARGYTHNAFPIGPAVLWSPAFAVAHVVAWTAGAFGSPIPLDGRSWPYDAAVGLGALVVGALGVLATVDAARRVATRRSALAAVLLVWLAGPIVYYTHVEPMAGHAAGFASSAVLLALWLRWRANPSLSSWHLTVLGLAAGLAILCRWQNAVLAVGLVADVLAGRLGGAGPTEGSARRRLAQLSIIGVAALVALAPQLVVWQTLYGSALRPPRGETAGAYLSLSRLHLVEVLASWRHGLYSSHPVLAFATAGLVVLARHRRSLGLALLLSLALTVVVNASVLDWWAGASFGSRRFDGMWPAFAIGLAVLIDRLPRTAVAVGGAALVAWNWLFLVTFSTERVSRIAAVRPADVVRALDGASLWPGLATWSGRKLGWIVGLLLVGAMVAWWGRAKGEEPGRVRRRAPMVVAIGAGAVMVGWTAAVLVAAREPGRHDPHVFEAGYFVPQMERPPRTDRVVRPGEDVWTLAWSFPGFLPPGRYVAVLADARAEDGVGGRATVRLDGRTVLTTPLTEESTSVTGPPFHMRSGFLRLEVDVEGGAVRVGAIHLLPAR